MIKSLSPHYITIPFVNPLTSSVCESFVLQIYVWDGLKNAVPLEPTYVITKTNPTNSNGNVKVNIARLVNDFVNFQASVGTTTDVVPAENQRWVLTQVFYDDAPTLPQIFNIQLLTKGYGYGLDGENPQIPTNKILIPITEYKVSKDSIFTIPIFVDEPEPVPPTLVLNSVTFISGQNYILNYTLNFNAPSVRGLYKLSTDSEYLIPEVVSGGSGTAGTRNVTVTIPITGSVNFVVRGYDPLTDILLTSNVVTITI
jgi:hypothetical protein